MPGRRLDEQKKRLIVELYRQGQSISRIAELLGVSKATVWRYVRKAVGGRGESESPEGGVDPAPSGGGEAVEEAVGEAESASAVDTSVEEREAPGVEPVTLVVDEVRKLSLEVDTVGRKLYLDPIVLLFYAYARRKGYRGSLADFIRDCIIDVMVSRGIHLAFIEVREGG